MNKVIIFGNSGSGKSTLACALAKRHQLSHLDLDTIAWQASNPPTRLPLEQSKLHIQSFLDKNTNWVIEGCYADLLALVAPFAEEAIFLNLPVSECVDNAKRRPWEPHKYPDKQAQDANLPMLIDWIGQYTTREDTFSLSAHERLYRDVKATKMMFKSNVSAHVLLDNMTS
ncbi:AAA family ATPase [Shewanella sp. WPAGA9]|uniref:AAA family ATPase n=1 Tax=Shewanella sp. ENK2 TaxID=2775245 RepID=UPI0017825705|nr:AAA family ATPase [Shewanella sp. WPAGA9]